MKKLNLFFILLCFVFFVACVNNSNRENATFNPGESPEEKVDTEREAKLDAKRAAYNAPADPMESITDFVGKLKFTIMVPSEGLSNDEVKILEAKMIQIVTANGIGGLGGNPRYVFAPEVNVLKKSVSSTAPVRHLVKCDITFYVADILTGTVFASQSIETTGVGDSETLAYIAMFKDLKVDNPLLQKMLARAEAKIIEYYKLHGTDFVREAKMLAASGEYSQAMAILGSIPMEAGDSLYKESVTLMSKFLDKHIEKECNLVLSQFKASLGNTQNGVNEDAMGYYAMIPANSPCKQEVDECYSNYTAQLSAKDQREWERDRAQIQAENNYRILKEELAAKVQISGNKCLLDKYKKDAAYNRLPWIRKVIHLGDYDPFDGYKSEDDC